jgi:hypothetical protein
VSGVRENPLAGSVVDHEHITVDEETYWGLMYLHMGVQRLLETGEVDNSYLAALSKDAEQRLQLTRFRLSLDPEHHRVPSTSEGE